MLSKMRVGIGYDTHRLVQGRDLILGGVKIEYQYGLDGHSDADVLTHAVIDALLGAAALGDIGQHFPDTDPAYKDADSLVLLRVVEEKLTAAGYQTSNVDTTVLLERPKLMPYAKQIKMAICDVLKISQDQFNLKATTGEGLGFIGRGEGVTALAVAMISDI